MTRPKLDAVPAKRGNTFSTEPFYLVSNPPMRNQIFLDFKIFWEITRFPGQKVQQVCQYYPNGNFNDVGSINPNLFKKIEILKKKWKNTGTRVDCSQCAVQEENVDGVQMCHQLVLEINCKVPTRHKRLSVSPPTNTIMLIDFLAIVEVAFCLWFFHACYHCVIWSKNPNIILFMSPLKRL